MPRGKTKEVVNAVSTKDGVRVESGGRLTKREAKAMIVAMDAFGRMEVARRIGKSYDGARDEYEALGYPPALEFRDFRERYKRGDISKAIIDAPARASWEKPPGIVERDLPPGHKKTIFEKQVELLSQRLKLPSYFSRADRMASLGRFSGIFLGFDKKGGPPGMPVATKTNRDLLYVMPYTEGDLKISTYVENTGDARYALPLMYRIAKRNPNGAPSPFTVHWSRIIHIVEDRFEDESEGTPKLEAPWNRLMDIDKVLGASAEGFWRAGFPGYAFKADADSEFGAQDKADLEDQILRYMHGFQRYLRTKGITVEGMQQQIADPTNIVSTEMNMVAGSVRIPKRIMMGSERGEMSSKQDDEHWNDIIGERQLEFCEPEIVRQFWDRMIDYRVVRKPSTGEYDVVWPDRSVVSESDAANVGVRRSVALRNYIEGGISRVMPAKTFMAIVMGLAKGQIDSVEIEAEKILADHNAAADEPKAPAVGGSVPPGGRPENQGNKEVKKLEGS